MNITKNIHYVGVNDHEIDLFESQYHVPNGMAYNSYVIMDEKIAVMDSVDAQFTKSWLDNIQSVLEEKKPDYLIVQHMEPDHSGSICCFMEAFPDAKIVSSSKSFAMMKNFFEVDFSQQQILIGDGDTLSLGSHTLNFIAAPMVHWPEVMMTYDSTDKVLFSADAFGTFGALDVEEADWAGEARRYYIGIVGKYGAQVQALLKKAAALDIQTICSLHGPILTENLDSYINLYHTWSSYEAEEEGVVIAYTSVYGNTKKAVLQLADKLRSKGCPKVVVNDLARCDMSKAVSDAFQYRNLVLATTTYNADIFPFMREFLHHLTERNYSNRRVAFIENGSWAPTAAKTMKRILEKSKNLSYANTIVTITSALNEKSAAQLSDLADELCSEPPSGQNPAVPETSASEKKKFVCKICGYVYEGDELPEDFICPLCKRGADAFEEIK